MTKLNKRVLSALLAVILLLTNFPVVSAASDSFAIYYEDKTVTEVEFYEHERITVSAEGIPGGTYQWQIQIPGTEQWVNIQGQTSQTINLSKAVVGSLMSGGSAYVRCAAISDAEEIDHTAALRTTVKKEEPAPVAPVVNAPVVTPVEPVPEATEAPTEAPAEPIPETTEPPVEAAEAPTEPIPEATEAPAEVTDVPTEPAVENEPAPEIVEPTEVPAETTETPAEVVETPAETAAPAEPEAEAVVAAPVEESTAATEAPTEPTPEATEMPTEATEEPAEVTVEAIEVPAEVTETPAETAAPTEPEAEAVATAPAEEPAAEATEPAEEKPAQTFVEKVVQMFAPKANADGESTDETEAAEASDDVDVSVVTVAIHYRAVDRRDKFEKPYVSDDETDTTDYADANSKDNAAKADEVIDPYEAHIVSGSDLNVTIPCHVIPGYELVIPSFYEDANPGIAVNGTNLIVTLEGVSQNTDLYVYYKETTVSYTARYFIQNVYNDLYTEDTSILTPDIELQMKGFPGDEPDEDVIYPTVYGFTALFFQPDTIASDGSTVFEVYYDRNYYLMNFNMDGGYGTAPVYARYGTAFTVAQPTKSGHTFNGWKEDESKRAVNADGSTETDSAFVAALETHINGIDKLNGRVTKIPFSNLTYKADWTQQATTYKVAYWILNDNGKKTYLGGNLIGGTSGDKITSFKKLGTDVDTSPAVCGKTPHTHTDDCKCSHTHSPDNGCYAAFGASTTTCPNAGVFNALGVQNGSHEEPKSGYAYKLENSANGTVQYLAVYRAVTNGSAGTAHYYTISESNLGAQVETITEGNYTLTKYQAILSCGHVHGSACDGGYICGLDEHTHTVDECYVDTRHMTLVRSDLGEGSSVTNDVVIEGDGSTVLNVYYQYKEYTLKFYYAMSSGTGNNTKYYVIGGSTYRFGSSATISNKGDEIKLLDHYMSSYTSERGGVDELPQLNSRGQGKKYTTGTEKSTVNRVEYTYYYISFKARYGDDISNMWPCDVFNSVTRTDKNNANGWSGEEAFVSAWNGEHHVAYCYNEYNGTGNQTIKGVYEKLDDAILFHPQYTDETEVSYLCFWENGANADWSVPELYVYNIWLPFTGENFENLPEAERKIHDGIQYYLHDTYHVCDDSLISKQTVPSLTGYVYKNTEWGAIFISQAVQDGEVYKGQGKDDSKVTYNSTTKIVHDASGWKSDPQSLTVEQQENGKYFLYSDDYNEKYYDAQTLNPSVYREAYFRDFYYKANGPYKLNFWNHNDWLNSGEGVKGGVYYGASLRKYFDGVTVDGTEYDGANDIVLEKYPSTLEPDAYTFAGWYETPEFYEETRVNWETMTMPDADLTVHAKWEPVKYTTYFYMDYERYEQKRHYATIVGTPHGENMVLDGFDPKPTFVDAAGKTNSKYKFVNWFYIDTDGTKKAFNPSEMAVRKELHLFAEWTTSIVQEYKVSYVYGVWSESEGKYVAASPACTMAADSTGYALEATTKTFTALPKNKLTNFPAGTENLLWLPHTNSHSIVMRATQTQEVDGETVTVNPNVHTFYYIKATEVNYTVKYLDAATGASVLDEKTTTLTAGMVPAGVITEPFTYVAGYIPDAFHKRLVLSADASKNVIVFYYTKDEAADDDVGTGGDVTRQRYLVVHHFPGLTATDEEVTVEDTDIGNVNATVTVDEMENPGFEFDEKVTKAKYIERFGSSSMTDAEKTALANKNVVQKDGTWKVSGIVTTGKDEGANKPLELHLYYKRGLYNYRVEHRDWETKELIKETVDGVEKDLVETFSGKAFEETVTATSKIITGYDVYAPDVEGGSTKTLTLKISWNEKSNEITFYYIKKKVKVSYIPICTDSAITDGFGIVTNPMDYDKTQETLTGSEAYAESGFHFLGWYTDQDMGSGTLITTDAQLTSEKIKLTSGVFDYTYYAVFEPITLTISQTNMNATDSAVYEIVQGSNVIARVMLTGNDSVTLQAIPVGTYTVREVSRTDDDDITYDWTWTYGDPTATPAGGQITVVAGENKEVAFNYAKKYEGSCWLHSETHR